MEFYLYNHQRLEVVQPDVLWTLKKPLCRLRCAPKRWSSTREECINTFEIMDDDWGTSRCIQ
eukprot:12936419-Prorocentrum_lima.AAC.1